MQVQKLRYAAQDNGLVPAGRYFAKLAQSLRDANEQEAARREQREAQERKLEARHRRNRSAGLLTRPVGDASQHDAVMH